MTLVFGIIALGLFIILVFVLISNKRLEGRLAASQQETQTARQELQSETARIQGEVQVQLDRETERVRQHYETETVKLQGEAQAAVSQSRKEAERAKDEARVAISNAQKTADQYIEELKNESERIRQHYETEARKAQQAVEAVLKKTLSDLEPLRKYAALGDAELEIKRVLNDALQEANALRSEAQHLLESSRNAAADERSKASQKAKEIRQQADALLNQATLNAGQIVQEAEKRAEKIGGDAYIALRDKETLEQAVKALWNVAEGYGDRYVVPTRSLLDDLAEDFEHTEAGEALKQTRENSRRMVEQRQASACNYVEEDRRDRANRFVVDAFNGRVDAILSRSKHDNYGTLEQEIRDAFSLVNLNGIAFRDARILPAYLDARLAELKWAVIVQELKLQEREEQRRIQEQMREEEKARREFERAIKEAADEEAKIKSAMEKARAEVENANAQERAKLEQQLAQLNQRLVEAEAKNQRALSMAQQTRSGHVYIVSNIGSFGDTTFKIGMTRRLEPLDRIWELGDASVPFDFDVHAMIYSEDAPTLERSLHMEFDDLRINKVNYRKEFFRIPLERIKAFVDLKGLSASFTLAAEAREFRETQALEAMSPEERQKYRLEKTNGKAVQTISITLATPSAASEQTPIQTSQSTVTTES